MPVRDSTHWEPKLGQSSPCHYGDDWLDRYADTVRKAGVARIWPDDAELVLDVGCGDGQFAAWLKQEFNVAVAGVDAYHWPGAEDRLDALYVEDAETFAGHIQPQAFDLAVCVTSLPFMQDWHRCIAGLVRACKRVLVVDNLQHPPPEWQLGLPEKQPISYWDLVQTFDAHCWSVEAATAINVLDRRLFFHLPGWLAYALTVPIDLMLAPSTRPPRARYSAVLFAPKVMS
jgi:SAM-dependent methyltransferase